MKKLESRMKAKEEREREGEERESGAIKIPSRDTGEVSNGAYFGKRALEAAKGAACALKPRFCNMREIS